MLDKALIHPRSIAVIGGSNKLHKPGGSILRNLLEGSFSGQLYVVNPGEEEVQGVRSYASPEDLPRTDLAVLAVAAAHCPPIVEYLAENKGTRGFIVLSAGFAEEGKEGTALEREMAESVERTGGSLIGPNCIGVITGSYQAVFTTPVPQPDPSGCDFISGSGATAVFIMEAGMANGLKFSEIWSVGNSAQTSVEDVLAHMDETFDPDKSSRVKLLYLEHISDPDKLLRHARSLHGKGCRIAAIKSGISEAGSRAASSHTGALATPDSAVDALFRKAGIVRCSGRSELVAVASVFMHKELKGKNLAVITHAGGPAVMLTDALSAGGLRVPKIEDPRTAELLGFLHPGSSVTNPIDFLATGTAEQLDRIIDDCEKHFNSIDGMIVIFGSPGLFPVDDVYAVLDEKIDTCTKPVYPVLPSVINARREIGSFLERGRLFFPDEVALGRALSLAGRTPAPAPESTTRLIEEDGVVRVVGQGPKKGWLDPGAVGKILDAAGIPRVGEIVAGSPDEALEAAGRLNYPLVMKAAGPVHKSDVGGISLNVGDGEEVKKEFLRLMKIEGTHGVIIQEMVSGTELFAGIRREDRFGHLVMCGAGGIFVEVFEDVATGLAPLGEVEAGAMIRSLRSFPMLEGTRGREGVDMKAFEGILLRLSELAAAAPGISEMDLNPLIATPSGIIAVDARILMG